MSFHCLVECVCVCVRMTRNCGERKGECNGEMCTIKCGEGVQSVAESLPAGELVPATRHTAHCQHQCAMCQHHLPTFPKRCYGPSLPYQRGRWRGRGREEMER